MPGCNIYLLLKTRRTLKRYALLMLLQIFIAICVTTGVYLNIGFPFQWWEHILANSVSPPDFPDADLKSIVEELKNNEDIRSFPTAYIDLTYPEKNPYLFDLLVHPYDGHFTGKDQSTLSSRR